MRRRGRRAGFTLVEVMLALAILGVALVLLVKSVAGNITSATEAFYMGVATDLGRGKMYDLEEQILQDGFQETAQELDGDFGEEGWPSVTWKASIVPTELPSFDDLMGLQNPAEGEAAAAGAPPPGAEPGDREAAAAGKFQNSALGSMMGMFGGGADPGGDGAAGATTGAFMQGYYGMIQEILKASIRKITLTVGYQTGVRAESVDVILYVVDTAGMAKSLGPMWRQQ